MNTFAQNVQEAQMDYGLANGLFYNSLLIGGLFCFVLICVYYLHKRISALEARSVAAPAPRAQGQAPQHGNDDGGRDHAAPERG